MLTLAMSALFVMLGFFHFVSAGCKAETFNRESIEAYFQEIADKDSYIEVYGAFQKFLGKRQIENFTIYKTSYNGLVEPKEAKVEQEIDGKIKALNVIWNYLREKRIPFLYIEPPLAIADEEDLPAGVSDHSDDNADVLHRKLTGISIIKISETGNLNKENMFYRTDHHWSGDACFRAYEMIADRMIEENMLKKRTSGDKFSRVSVGGFLGSYGIKAGKYYDGTDEYVYYQPDFDTKIEFNAYDPEGKLTDTRKGSWTDALMDTSVLTDPDYHNKYNAALWGNAAESRILNHEADNDNKLLLISHSYGRPLATYFALDFQEVRMIDPQEGRFSGDYLQYIDEFEPDAVLFLCEIEGEIIGEYRLAE